MMKVQQKELAHKLHPDDEWFDEVKVMTVPRYKTSDLSGDEWRIGIHVQFFKKGVLVAEMSKTNMMAALLQSVMYLRECAEFREHVPEEDVYCDQPGCKEKAVSTYMLKEEFSRYGEGPLPPNSTYIWYRRFCTKHLERGDCGREDADRNYVVKKGDKGPNGSTNTE